MTSTVTDTATPASTRAERIADRLFHHQVEGVAFLLRRRRAILADDMGLGKTRQAVIGLHVGEPGGPYLVVCPASVKRNWQREIEAALPGARSRIIAGKSDTAPLDADWVIVNYDILGAHAERLRAVPWRGMVFDEAHYLKNHQSQRSRHARSIVDAADDPLVYALAGTPLTNRPRDLFPLLQLCGHALARSFLSFARRYCAAYQTDYGWVTDGASKLDELAVQLHGLMLRRTKDEVLDLPPKLRTWLPVEVPAGTGAKEMGDVVRLLLDRQTGGRSTRRGGEAADRGRLLASLTWARQKLAAAKAADTIDFIENAVGQGEKVIVFSCFDEPLKKVQKHFGDAAVLLTGATPTARRQTIVDQFQAREEVRVFAANTIAGGVGINLTAARQVVFNDLDRVPRESLAGRGPRLPHRTDKHGECHLHDCDRDGGRLREHAPRGEDAPRMSSSSRPGQAYAMEVDAAGDVTCGCPGFQYRGQCSHGRALKSALAWGRSLPSGCELVTADAAPA